MKKLLVRLGFKHMGNHSGYDNVFQYLQKSSSNYLSEFKEENKINNLKSVALYLLNKEIPKTSFYLKRAFELEHRSIHTAIKNRCEIIHYTYVENNFGLLSQSSYQKKIDGCKIVGTIHQPMEWWKSKADLSLLNHLDALITLSENEKELFEEILPGKVHFIPHAADTNHFKPGIKHDKTFRCLTVGNWMRDFTAISNCIQKINKQNPEIKFDIIYNKPISENKAYAKLLEIEQVTFHSRIPDQALLDLYHNASILLLPLLNATANNAILESAACGLPILTTEIESLKSYTDPTFTFYFPKNDFNQMAEWVLEKYHNPQEISNLSSLARAYSVNNLDIKVVAGQLEKLYESLI